MKTPYIAIIVIIFSSTTLLQAYAWCAGCIPPDQLQTNRILIPSVVAAAVIGIWFFLFRHFKD